MEKLKFDLKYLLGGLESPLSEIENKGMITKFQLLL